MKSKIIGLIGLMFVMSISLKCKDKDEDDQGVSFEKKELMIQVADQYLIPAYQDLNLRIQELQEAWSSFESNPATGDLNQVRNKWIEANLAFQGIKLIDFGPAYQSGMVITLGTFPTDTSQIESNLNAASWDLNAGTNFAAIGFAALDYMLFNTNAANRSANSASYRQYIHDLVAKMKNEVQQTLDAWSSYRSTFIEGTGNSSTSPFAQLVNAFCKDYELCKNAKIGIPIGRQSLGIQRPEYLEAPYSGYNKDLLVANLAALKKVFAGNGFVGGDGKGFDDYLIALDKASLVTSVNNKFDQLIQEPNNWSGNVKDMMLQNPASLDAYYDQMQGLVVNLKTDMASAFGILITYQDNDGD